MLILLPILLFIVIFYLNYLWHRTSDLRIVWVKTTIHFGTFILLSTTILSLFQSLTTPYLAGTYVGVISGYCLLIRRYSRAKLSIEYKDAIKSFLNWLKTQKQFIFDSKAFYYIFFVLLIILGTFLIAKLAAPNNYDSMTYHLSRVIHWGQNNSVAHYATHIERQLYSGPLAEYAIAHIYLLNHSDQWFNFVQWISFLGSMITVSLIVKILGGSKFSQLLAVVFVATAPMMILQSTSTQNDLVGTYMVLVLAYLVVSSIKSQTFSTGTICLIGLTLGLGTVTKGTFPVFVLPFVLWYVFELTKSVGAFKTFKFAIITLCLALGLNGYFMYQNYQIYSNPLGQVSDIQLLRNTTISPSLTLANLAKNIGSNLSLPNDYLIDIEYQAISKFNQAIGHNIANTSENFINLPYDLSPQTNVHEDIAGNPFQIVAILFFTLLFFIKFRATDYFTRGFILSTITGVILFAALFRWQPWINRLDLPLLALGSVFVVVTDKTKLQSYSYIFFDLMLFAAIFPLFFNNIRPIFGSEVYKSLGRNTPSILDSSRANQYFSQTPGLFEPYNQLINKIKETDCREIGLIIGGDTNEYQLYSLDPDKLIHWHQINVTGPSSKKVSKNLNICAVATVNYPPLLENEKTELISYQNKSYRINWGNNFTKLYLPQ